MIKKTKKSEREIDIRPLIYQDGCAGEREDLYAGGSRQCDESETGAGHADALPSGNS